MSENERLSAKQQKAIAALLAEPTNRAAAKTAGISEATMGRWLSDPAFSAAYQEAQRDSFKSTMARLRAASATAVDTLEIVMKDKEAPHAARVSAAKAVLDVSLRVREQDELESRLKMLERIFAATPKSRKR